MEQKVLVLYAREAQDIIQSHIDFGWSVVSVTPESVSVSVTPDDNSSVYYGRIIFILELKMT